MLRLRACLKKDMIEFFRCRKNIICACILLGIGAMVILTTLFIPNLIDRLAEKSPHMISDPKAIQELMKRLFPDDVAGSLKTFAADIGVFYTMAVCFMCHSILPEEISGEKWILPVNSGIEQKTLILSKCIVYSAGTGFPVFVIFNLFYFIASFTFSGRCTFSTVLLNGVILSIAVSGIVTITILLSLIYRHSIFSALSVILVVMTAPDILSFFSFGKWFPTYLLTYAYSLENRLCLTVIPTIALLVLIIFFYFQAEKRCRKIGSGY